MAEAASASSVERFNGFSDEMVQFFLELQAEQSRAWFKAHQDDFTRLCRRPLELFVSELRERLLDVYPGLADTEPHYFRIQRDTRFARDKSPYKTYVAANIALRPQLDDEDRHLVPGMYVSFGLEGEYVGVGAWHMSPAILARYRAAVADPKLGGTLQSALNKLLAQGWTIESMEHLKRVPPPYPQDHPRADLLKHKGLALAIQPSAELSATRALLDWAETNLRATAPVIRWLDSQV